MAALLLRRIAMPDSIIDYLHDDDIADDRIEGANAIAAFYFGENTYANRKRVYYGYENRRLPIGKEFGKLVASKRRLRAHHASLTDAPDVLPGTRFDIRTETRPEAKSATRHVSNVANPKS